jgi:hypothetical protein
MSALENRRLSGWLGVAAFLSVAAVVVHMIALPAMRFNDPINDPWHVFAFYRYGLDSIFLIPVLTGIISWTYYEVFFWNTIHLVGCLGCLGWGLVVIVYGILDEINRNEFTGLLPDVPWAINRNYPADQNPDMFWYFCFISTVVSTIMTIAWIILGTRIRGANLANIYARSSQILASKFVGSKLGQAFVGDAIRARMEQDAIQYTKEVNGYVQSAISNYQADHPEANQILIQALADEAYRVGQNIRSYEASRGLDHNPRSDQESLERTLRGEMPLVLTYK